MCDEEAFFFVRTSTVAINVEHLRDYDFTITAQL